jgi:hypothetical protein
MSFRIALFIMVASLTSTSLLSQTMVFKVRAPAPECTIITTQDYLLLELDNPVQVKVRGPHNMKVKVKLVGGKIVNIKDDIYYMRFTKSGVAAISVYQITPNGLKLMETKEIKVKSPDVYFCNMKIDSISRALQLRSKNLTVYSNHFKKELDIVSFDFYYIEDTTKTRSQPIKIHSDNCMLTPEMKKIVSSFQPKYNQIYMHNIICQVPDGTKRILDPIRLNIIEDSKADRLTLIYQLKRKVL